MYNYKYSAPTPGACKSFVYCIMYICTCICNPFPAIASTMCRVKELRDSSGRQLAVCNLFS